jgi:membrane fusion protein, multidrug efflux system
VNPSTEIPRPPSSPAGDNPPIHPPGSFARPGPRSALVGLALVAIAATAAMIMLPTAAQGDTAPPAAASAPALAAFKVADQPVAGRVAYDGVVEAVRSTVMAAQVAGAVVQIEVKAGDRVKAGQLLMRLDARAADQSAVASSAQVEVARAQLEVATREVERQRQLFEQQFISRSALDHAEAQFRAARAQVDAQLAQSGVARTQTAFHLVRAPFTGIVADVPVTLGDMALPGRPLVTVYDPTALRVSAAVPQSLMAKLGTTLTPNSVRLELPGLAGSTPIQGSEAGFEPARVVALPTIDAATHTATLRADLPPGSSAAMPGLFARVWLPVPADAAGSAAAIRVPSSTLVRRAEMTAVYVLDGRGQPLLRQVRLGRTSGDQVEVLAGLSPGESVAADPQAAARIR